MPSQRLSRGTITTRNQGGGITKKDSLAPSVGIPAALSFLYNRSVKTLYKIPEPVQLDTEFYVYSWGRNGSSGFVSKTNKTTGNLVWTKSFYNGSYTETDFVAVDAENNVYVTGFYYATALPIYNPDNSETPVFVLENNSSSSVYTFIIKYDHNGYLLWATNIDGETDIFPTKMLLDTQNNLYISGGFSSTTHFNSVNNLVVPIEITTGNMGIETFLAKYDANGVCLWGTKMLGDLSDIILKLFLDANDNIYLVGLFGSSTMNIYNQGNNTEPSTVLYKLGTNVNAFIIKYNTAGECFWASYVSGLGNDNINVVMDKEDRICFSGTLFGETVSFFNSFNYEVPAFSFGDQGTTDAFLGKYDTDGTCLWATALRGDGYDRITDVVVDSENNLYITGDFYSSTLYVYNQGQTETPAIIMPHSGDTNFTETFIIKYSPVGDFIWATHLDGNNNGYSIKMAVDNTDNVYISNVFVANITIYSNGSGETSFASNASYSFYVAKFDGNGVCLAATYMDGYVDITQFRFDADNQVYFLGNYGGNGAVYSSDNLETPAYTLIDNINNEQTSLFIIKFNPALVFQWATTKDTVSIGHFYMY